MATAYAPGCALKIYKPHLTEKVLEFLQSLLFGEAVRLALLSRKNSTPSYRSL